MLFSKESSSSEEKSAVVFPDINNLPDTDKRKKKLITIDEHLYVAQNTLDTLNSNSLLSPEERSSASPNLLEVESEILQFATKLRASTNIVYRSISLCLKNGNLIDKSIFNRAILLSVNISNVLNPLLKTFDELSGSPITSVAGYIRHQITPVCH